MKNKQSMIIFFGIALLLLTVGTASAVTYNVTSVPGPLNYTTIQNAVNAAANRDTITVYSGTYTENVNVNKALTIESYSGNPNDTIVKAANPSDDVFYVTADNVNINGFNITRASINEGFGIYLYEVENSNISNNKLSNFSCGIELVNSSDNMLTGNNASNNVNGIELVNSSDNMLTGNTVSHNYWGIELFSSSGNTLTNNTASNSPYGIRLWIFCNDNMLTSNTVSNNAYGIDLVSSNDNKLTCNTASNNVYGIDLEDSSDNILTDNAMIDNTYNFGGGGVNDIDTSNTVDGKPIYYLVGISNITLDSTSNAGTVYCINCQDLFIKDLSLENSVYGIYLYNTTESSIDNNIALKNMYGIYLVSSNGNTLTSNTASNSSIGTQLWTKGVQLRNSSDNTLTGNTASNNSEGIDLVNSSDNTLTSNTASNNSIGIYLYSSSGNVIYNNYFNNINNVRLEISTANVWNSTKTPGRNIVGGPYVGGNYWATPDNDGFSQENADTDGDGFCDSPLSEYELDGNNIDHLPLYYITHLRLQRISKNT